MRAARPRASARSSPRPGPAPCGGSRRRRPSSRARSAIPQDRHGVSRIAWPKPVVAASIAAVGPRAAAAAAAASREGPGRGALAAPRARHAARSSAGSHARGIAVIAWTVNDPEAVERLAGLQVDAIVSDDPGMAMHVLATLKIAVNGGLQMTVVTDFYGRLLAVLAATGVAAFAVFAGRDRREDCATKHVHAVPSGVRIAGIRVGGLDTRRGHRRREDRLRGAASARRSTARRSSCTRRSSRPPTSTRPSARRARPRSGTNIHLVVVAHGAAVRAAVAKLARRFDQKPRNASLGFVAGRPRIKPERRRRLARPGRAAPARRPLAHGQLAAPDLAEGEEDAARPSRRRASAR